MKKPLAFAAALIASVSFSVSRAYACDPITQSQPHSVDTNPKDIAPPEVPTILGASFGQSAVAAGPCAADGSLVVSLSVVTDDVSPKANIGFLLEPLDDNAPFEFPKYALVDNYHASESGAQVSVTFGHSSSLEKFSFSARSVDAAGNMSKPSAPFEITPDPKRIYRGEGGGCQVGVTTRPDPASGMGMLLLVAATLVRVRTRRIAT